MVPSIIFISWFCLMYTWTLSFIVLPVCSFNALHTHQTVSEFPKLNTIEIDDTSKENSKLIQQRASFLRLDDGKHYANQKQNLQQLNGIQDRNHYQFNDDNSIAHTSYALLKESLINNPTIPTSPSISAYSVPAKQRSFAHLHSSATLEPDLNQELTEEAWEALPNCDFYALNPQSCNPHTPYSPCSRCRTKTVRFLGPTYPTCPGPESLALGYETQYEWILKPVKQISGVQVKHLCVLEPVSLYIQQLRQQQQQQMPMQGALQIGQSKRIYNTITSLIVTGCLILTLY